VIGVLLLLRLGLVAGAGALGQGSDSRSNRGRDGLRRARRRARRRHRRQRRRRRGGGGGQRLLGGLHLLLHLRLHLLLLRLQRLHLPLGRQLRRRRARRQREATGPPAARAAAAAAALRAEHALRVAAAAAEPRKSRADHLVHLDLVALGKIAGSYTSLGQRQPLLHPLLLVAPRPRRADRLLLHALRGVGVDHPCISELLQRLKLRKRGLVHGVRTRVWQQQRRRRRCSSAVSPSRGD